MNSLEFLRLVGRLKKLKRTGWGMQGVPNGESVAEHMYRAAMCAFLIPSNVAVDRDRCIKIALVHDLCEALAGDITPHCGVSKEEKHRLEKEAMITITSHVDEALRAELNELWLEYEAGETEEAKYVKDIDKFEMILQADEYETAQENLNLDSFFRSTQDKFVTPLFQTLDAELRASRAARSPNSS
jgi:putative hydrolase of HD superfamily